MLATCCVSRAIAVTVRTVRRRVGVRLAMAGLAASGLSACAENIGSAVVGLPAEDFDRAYVAGLDIAAAQRCGVAVDAGVVRINLVEDAKRRGRNDATAEKAGRAFDKTRAEFARKLQSRPEFCVSQYAVSPEALALYRKGEFSGGH